MASKSLRRLLRSGVLFFMSTRTHEAAFPACIDQGLLMHSSPVRASRFLCLPLSSACHYLQPSSSSSTFLYPSADLSAIEDVADELKQLVRSHSCSKLHGRKASNSHTSLDHGCSRGRCAPKGHVAVYVDTDRQRDVVPIAYLSHPLFQGLLERAEKEYGYRQKGPGLRIPCSLSELYHTLHHIRTQ